MAKLYNFNGSLFYSPHPFHTNISGKENKLFWDGGEWNQVAKSVKHDYHLTFKNKEGILERGVLDGRLFSYLNVWKLNRSLQMKHFLKLLII